MISTSKFCAIMENGESECWSTTGENSALACTNGTTVSPMSLHLNHNNVSDNYRVDLELQVKQASNNCATFLVSNFTLEKNGTFVCDGFSWAPQINVTYPETCGVSCELKLGGNNNENTTATTTLSPVFPTSNYQGLKKVVYFPTPTSVEESVFCINPTLRTDKASFTSTPPPYIPPRPTQPPITSAPKSTWPNMQSGDGIGAVIGIVVLILIAIACCGSKASKS